MQEVHDCARDMEEMCCSPFNSFFTKQVVLLDQIQPNAQDRKKQMQCTNDLVVDFRARPEESSYVVHAELGRTCDKNKLSADKTISQRILRSGVA